MEVRTWSRRKPSEMGFTTAAVGALFGFTVQIYANAVRKLPVMRSPWEHMIWAGLGATAFTVADRKKAELEVEVQEMITRRAEKSQGPPRRMPE